MTTLRSLIQPRHGRRTRRASSFDRSGGNRDYWQIPVGESVTLAEIAGAGCVTHLWFTINCPGDKHHLRHLVLRAYWDGEETPSIECPIGDFFNVGHGIAKTNASLPFTTSANADQEKKLGGNMAMNCWFQMPFGSGARITVSNEGVAPVESFYFYVDYEEWDSCPDETLRFHAQWRRERLTTGEKGDLTAQGENYWKYSDYPNPKGEGNYVILEAAGAGHFVGCNISIDNIDPTPDGLTWWGEGDDMIFIDGEETPSLIGTGSEDYLGHAWGMQPHAFPYHGTSLYEHDPERPGRRKTTVYRFHIEDPVIFTSTIKVTIEHGHANLQQNDYSSTAYWYQSEPHTPFPPLPPAPERRARPDLF